MKGATIAITKLIKHILTLSTLLTVSTALAQSMTIKASYYAKKFENRKMANGERFHGYELVAASLDFPIGSTVEVRNVETGKRVWVRITDRGPWHTRFKMDLSPAAFQALGVDLKQGWVEVEVYQVGDMK